MPILNQKYLYLELLNNWRNEKGYLIINIFDFLLNPDSLNL